MYETSIPNSDMNVCVKPPASLREIVAETNKIMIESLLCTANTIHSLTGAMPEMNKSSEPKSLFECMIVLRENADRLMALTHELAQTING